MLWKGFYPYESMGNWEKFIEATFSEKEDFQSQLNIEDSTDGDYAQAKRICKEFEIKNLGDVCSKRYIILIDVFENLNIYELDPAKFL